MNLGSPEHKKQTCEELIKTYHENIWKDEIYLITLGELRDQKKLDIVAIEAKLEAKEYKTKNEGEKAKFVVLRELEAIEKEYAETEQKAKSLWPARIKAVEKYLES